MGPGARVGENRPEVLPRAFGGGDSPKRGAEGTGHWLTWDSRGLLSPSSILPQDRCAGPLPGVSSWAPGAGAACPQPSCELCSPGPGELRAQPGCPSHDQIM